MGEMTFGKAEGRRHIPCDVIGSGQALTIIAFALSCCESDGVRMVWKFLRIVGGSSEIWLR
jgi:hypothetical protein